ncbi:dihydroorotate dehydrogenase [Sinanaerobacter sp. ZZT-01]|uniref:dihydroorotate dehydrogenase n=1 Tax=Sinanaerobacter sp. ZZT-01 TaxID=3111540 RepID=UPI002D78C328|nr:dihydroorotate dehydrogenase [Sinanaerobacter sp. ZZT-01]WRR93550.1 dihydroorotate dehydrogenase [Sinanaerobacter sp. ZZT-01]
MQDSTLKQSDTENLNLNVTIAGVKWKNPITTASGTFSAKESSAFYDLSKLGAVTTKGVSNVPWTGNPTPRIAETYGGMLNAVGLQNPGVESFITEEIPYIRQYETNLIANVAGHTLEEYCHTVKRLEDTDVDMLEINISCPNVKEGGIGFGTNAKMAAEVTKKVRGITKKPVIIKLTPNVTNISEIAKAVEAEGADAISLINTLLGMRIDVRRAKTVLANRTGGLSGPAIKPIAIRMVYEVRKVVSIPIIGLGGIMNGEDVAEFLMAGANAVAIGTAALIRPTAPIEILEELKNYMREMGYHSIKEIQNAFCD